MRSLPQMVEDLFLRTREPLAGDEDKRERTGAFAREIKPAASWPVGELESGHRADEHVV